MPNQSTYDDTCHTCGGSGTLQCNKCYGSGSVVCFKCEGSGHVLYLGGGISFRGHGIPGGQKNTFGFRQPEPIALGNSGPCNKCDATGRLPCLKCSSRGYVMCMKCNGSGRFQREYRASNRQSDEPRVTGIVKFYNREKGFGFASEDNTGAEVYINAKNLLDTSELRSGDRISFIVRNGNKGSWAAQIERA